MKVIKIQNHLTVILNDGTVLTNSNCTDELYNQVIAMQDNEGDVQKLLAPELTKKVEEAKAAEELLSDFNSSRYLTVFGNSVYIKSISELTVPQDLAVALFRAEKDNNQELIDSYLNFWTLCSLNPDSRARTNLFWFLNKYGMKISKSGLFVAYRNVELKKDGNVIDTKLADFISTQYSRVKYKLKKSPKNYFVGKDSDKQLFLYTDASRIKDDKANFIGNLAELYLNLSNETQAPVYTDSYTRSFTIKIGEPVVMDRDKCDTKQENTCSRGLHVAGRSWLQNGYFGQLSLMVLVNPADVVAVPPQDNYGKMRVCAYYPVQLIQRDEEGNIIDQEIEDGFEDDFVNKIAYNGVINNEDIVNYTIAIPEIPELNRTKIIDKLHEIAKSMKKYVN